MTVCSPTSHWNFSNLILSLQLFWPLPGAVTLCIHVAMILCDLGARAICHWPAIHIHQGCPNYGKPGSGSLPPCPSAMVSWVSPTPPGHRAARVKLGSPHTKVDSRLGHTPQIVLGPRLACPVRRHRLWARRFAGYRARCPGEKYLPQWNIINQNSSSLKTPKKHISWLP